MGVNEWPERWFVTALGHPLRVAILELLNEREASPSEMQRPLEESLGVINYHVGVLKDCGCVEVIRTRQVRGAVEHFYRAVPRSYVGHQDLRDVPQSIRGLPTGISLKSFLEASSAAIQAGKVDGRDDTVWSWMTVAVDDLGWQSAVEISQGALRAYEQIARQSRERSALSNAALMPVVVAVATFEAVKKAD